MDKELRYREKGNGLIIRYCRDVCSYLVKNVVLLDSRQLVLDFSVDVSSCCVP